MNKKVFLFISLLILSMAFASYMPEVNAQQTTVYVDPGRITGLDAGETFTVDIKVANVTDLMAWEIRIFYKSSVLNATDIAGDSPFLKQHPNPNATTFYGIHYFNDNYNETHGQIIAYCALYNVPDGVSGSGTLFWVEFKAKGYGDSPLELSSPHGPLEYLLLDSSTNPIPHSTIHGAVHVGLRDVSVTNIEAPKSVPTNSIVKINVTAENQGEVSETFDVTLYYDSNQIETKGLIDLPAGEIRILTFTWDVSGVPIGAYTLTAKATQVVGEVDLSDNTYTLGIYVGIRDVAITNMAPSKTVTNDTAVYINVTVENHGEFAETFNVTVYYGTKAIGTQAVTSLTAGSAARLTFTWNTIVVPKGIYLITATATTVPGEINTEDNTYVNPPVVITETILGDVTADFKVDILDIATVAKAYGAYPGNPKWNPNADLDDSNLIDIIDIAKAAKNYGKQI